MFEIHITVSCPDLLAAANTIAGCFAAKTGAALSSATNAPAPSSTAPVAQVAPQPAPLPVATSIVPTAPPANPAVPLATVPTFTLEQVSRAGADLVTAEPGKMQALMALLGQFGVQTLDKLRPDQMGAFATALRGLGAKI